MLVNAAVTSVDGGPWQGHAHLRKAKDPLYHPDQGLDPGAHLGFDPMSRVRDLVDRGTAPVLAVREVLRSRGTGPDGTATRTRVGLVAPHSRLSHQVRGDGAPGARGNNSGCSQGLRSN